MPRKVVDPETGFIKFISTPEEKALRKVIEDNKALKEENDALKLALEKLTKRMDKAGI